MPLSAKHSTQTPIKIMVSVGDLNRGNIRKSTGNREANKSGDRDSSGFLIKKTQVRPDIKVNSIDREIKNKTHSKMDLFSDRRDSLKADQNIMKPKQKNGYFSQDLLSIGVKRNGDDMASTKSKIKLGNGLFSHPASISTDNRISNSKLSSSANMIKTQGQKIFSNQTPASTQKGFQLSSAVTQVLILINIS